MGSKVTVEDVLENIVHWNQTKHSSKREHLHLHIFPEQVNTVLVVTPVFNTGHSIKDGDCIIYGHKEEDVALSPIGL